jgi:N-acetyl sugar amidotransferase
MMTCNRCIYDETIPYITFNSEGVCNYCEQHDELERLYPTGDVGMAKLHKMAQKIRKEQRHSKYDVVVGVSGGTDSSYMLYLTKVVLGLRPLAVHADNTWNTDIANNNLISVTKSLQVDLYTIAVEEKEFNDIFKSFLKASVPDIDSPSDIALATVHYLACRKFNIKYIFEGHSFRTEGISPHGWFYMDAGYIRSVHKEFGALKMKTFPNLLMRRWLRWTIINRIKKIRPLYYIDYSKDQAREFLSKEFDWNYYGGHHMENDTSYFTNNYWLPKKFGYDLRMCEFSAQIRSGHLDRGTALERIAMPKPFDESILKKIQEKLSLAEDDLPFFMNQPNKTYRDYKTYKRRFERLRPLFYLLAKAELIPMSFYLKYTRKYPELQLTVES